MGHFDMASDPLGQASERASLCLFLRGDMSAAPHSVATTMTSTDLESPPARIPSLAPRWHWAAWATRIGMRYQRGVKECQCTKYLETCVTDAGCW